MAKLIKVLSIDGGGIRGIIPAMVLSEIERRTNRPICSMFDLIAGTSTGGILALGLTVPGNHEKPEYSAGEMVSLYKEKGNMIFPKSLWRKITSVGYLLDEKYDDEGLVEILKGKFGEMRLKDTLTNVLVTSYEIERRISFFFKSTKANDYPDTHDFPMWQVCRATSAAPTYFEPCKIDTNDNDFWALIDGGVFANNPGMCALVEAMTKIRELKNWERDDVEYLVVSLGTGELTRRIPYDDAKDWGFAEWAQPILGTIFHGVSDTVHYQLKQHLPPNEDGKKRYYRFQVRLNEGNDDLDDTSRTNIRVLKILAESLIRDESDDINDLCNQLKNE